MAERDDLLGRPVCTWASATAVSSASVPEAVKNTFSSLPGIVASRRSARVTMGTVG